MRKILSLLILFVLLLPMEAMANSETYTESFEKEKAYSIARQFLNTYYNAVEKNETFELKDIDCTDMCREYANDKVEAKKCKYIAYEEDDICNYNLSFLLIDASKDDDVLRLTIKASADFNYKNVDFESAYNELHQVYFVYQKEGFIIQDWYSPYDCYDLEIRGRKYSPLEAMSKEETCKLQNAQKEYKIKIEEYYKNIKNQFFDVCENIGNVVARKTLYELNKSAMVSWAQNNYNATIPNSGNSSQVSTYIDFPSISGAYDCTNFVSHAILAGGAPVYDTGNSGISATGWYCRNINDRSSSWSGVSNLYSFLTSNTTRGPVGTEIAYSNIYGPGGYFPYVPGDLMQFNNGSIWRHSAVITGYLGVNGGSVLEAAVTDRTNSNANNMNRRQSDVYPGEARRVIVLSGYYN